MKKPVVVFDFDKTLTVEDTLFGFYRFSSKSKIIFLLKYPLMLTAAAAFKFGIISNLTLKKIGVQLYLRGYTKQSIDKLGREYSEKIEFNDVYQNEFFKYSPKQVIIISASLEDYLKPLFSNYNVVGSRLLYDSENRVLGLERNMYGLNKKKWLFKNGIREVDIFYTDSYSDQPVIDISDRTFIVNKYGEKS